MNSLATHLCRDEPLAARRTLGLPPPPARAGWETPPTGKAPTGPTCARSVRVLFNASFRCLTGELGAPGTVVVAPPARHHRVARQGHDVERRMPMAERTPHASVRDEGSQQALYGAFLRSLQPTAETNFF